MRFFVGILFACLLMHPLPEVAQNLPVKVRLRWLTDTISLAIPCPLEMVIKHPANQIVFFPDSVAFSPYEIHRTEHYPTYTVGNTSTDSAIYWVQSFEIDSLQKIELPFGVLNEKDTLWQKIQTATFVRYLDRITGPIDSLQCKPDWNYSPVDEPVNALFWIISGGIVLLLIVGSVWIFYNPIKRFFIKRRLYLEYQQVIKKLQALIQSNTNPIHCINTANAAWKDYIAGNRRQFFRSLTTSELSLILQTDGGINQDDSEVLIQLCQLEDALNYANQTCSQEEIKRQINNLEKVLRRELDLRLAEVQK